MDLFDYLRGGKLNNLEEPFVTDPRDGPSPFMGLLGMKKKLDDITAAKFSDTSIFTCRNGVYRLVRSDPTIAVVANWVAGRPLYWVDKTLYKVTTVAAVTAEFAGVAIGSLDEAGTIKIMQESGEAPGLYDGALTKAAPALNDPLILKITSSLAAFDVALDATAWDNTVVKRYVGHVDEAAVAAALKRIYLNGSHVNQNRGIYT